MTAGVAHGSGRGRGSHHRKVPRETVRRGSEVAGTFVHVRRWRAGTGPCPMVRSARSGAAQWRSGAARHGPAAWGAAQRRRSVARLAVARGAAWRCGPGPRWAVFRDEPQCARAALWRPPVLRRERMSERTRSGSRAPSSFDDPRHGKGRASGDTAPTESRDADEVCRSAVGARWSVALLCVVVGVHRGEVERGGVASRSHHMVNA